MSSYCKTCGRQLDGNLQFCPGCGNATNTLQGPSPQQNTPPQQQWSGPAQQNTPPQQQQGGPAQQGMPPQQQWNGPPQQSMPPQQQWGGPPQQSMPPQQQWGGQPQQNTPPQQQWGGQPQQNTPPQQQWGGPPQQNTPPQQQWSGQPQQVYPQQSPAGSAPPKKGPLSKKMLIIIGAAVLVVILGVVLGIVLFGGNRSENEDFFEIGGDTIPTVKYVLGEKRKISDITSTTSKGTAKLVVKYSVDDNQGDEMKKYARALVDDFKFISVDEYDFSGSRGRDFQFVKESDEDDGYIVQVLIDFDSKGYTLTITRGKGTIEAGASGAPDDPDDPTTDTPATDAPVTEAPPTDAPATDAPATPTPESSPPPGEDVDIIVPELLAGGNTVDSVQANAPDGVTVVGQNPDGSFTFRMSTARQQELLDLSISKAKEVLDGIYDYDGVVVVAWWGPDDFANVNIAAENPFFANSYKAEFNRAIIDICQTVPMIQVYSGKGMESITEIGVENIEGGPSQSFTAPDALKELLGN